MIIITAVPHFPVNHLDLDKLGKHRIVIIVLAVLIFISIFIFTSSGINNPWSEGFSVRLESLYTANGAGYVTIRNDGNKSLRIDRVEARIYGQLYYYELMDEELMPKEAIVLPVPIPYTKNREVNITISVHLSNNMVFNRSWTISPEYLSCPNLVAMESTGREPIISGTLLLVVEEVLNNYAFTIEGSTEISNITPGSIIVLEVSAQSNPLIGERKILIDSDGTIVEVSNIIVKRILVDGRTVASHTILELLRGIRCSVIASSLKLELPEKPSGGTRLSIDNQAIINSGDDACRIQLYWMKPSPGRGIIVVFSCEDENRSFMLSSPIPLVEVNGERI